MMFKKGPSEAEKELKKEQQHVAELERKVGQLTYEVDWLKKNLEKSSNVKGAGSGGAHLRKKAPHQPYAPII